MKKRAKHAPNKRSVSNADVIDAMAEQEAIEQDIEDAPKSSYETDEGHYDYMDYLDRKYEENLEAMQNGLGWDYCVPQNESAPTQDPDDWVYYCGNPPLDDEEEHEVCQHPDSTCGECSIRDRCLGGDEEDRNSEEKELM